MTRTITKLVIAVELGPLQRSSGVVYVHDAELDGDENLTVGDRIELCDEGGSYYSAVVASIEPAEVGRRYRLEIRP